nr:phosphatidylserine decarboxylase [Planctomycetota bacterium]
MKLRRTLLTLLPKLALSRSTGLLTRLPLPSALRAPFYKRFARRYGVDLHEVALPLDQYRSFRDFF